MRIIKSTTGSSALPDPRLRFAQHFKILVLALPALLATKVVHADTLAAGDPATLLQLNEDFITGLTQPTSAAFLPDGKVVVTEQGGAVKIFEADGSNLG